MWSSDSWRDYDFIARQCETFVDKETISDLNLTEVPRRSKSKARVFFAMFWASNMKLLMLWIARIQFGTGTLHLIKECFDFFPNAILGRFGFYRLVFTQELAFCSTAKGKKLNTIHPSFDKSDKPSSLELADLRANPYMLQASLKRKGKMKQIIWQESQVV